MQRFGLCTLTALVLFIILQLSLMGNEALGAMALEPSSETDVQQLKPRLVPGNPILNPVRNTHTATQNSAVSITYDENIDPATVTTQTFAVHAMETGWLTQSYSVSGGEIKLTPNQPFKAGELVQVSATTSTLNLGGQEPISPTVWQFRATVTSGSGVFTDSGQNLGSSYTYAAPLGDLDGDGDLDAFTANDLSSNKVWFNQGGAQGGTEGQFQNSGQNLGNSRSVEAVLGDLDGDGDLDAFVGNLGANKVWLNQGGMQGGTSGQFQSNGQNLGSSNSRAVALGDLDGDGDLDAFVGNIAQANKVWINQGGIQAGTSGQFADSGQSLGSSQSMAVRLADLDDDGDLDAFVANRNNQANSVWKNNGHAIFTLSQSLGSTHSLDVELADVDHDGDVDAFVVNFNNQPNKVWLNNPSGTDIFTDTGPSLGSSNSRSVALGDVDADGDLDALVGNATNSTPEDKKVWLNQGGIQAGTTGEFQDSGQSLGTSRADDIVLGDVDRDGDLDAFIADGGTQRTNYVWLNKTACPGSICHVAKSGSDTTGDGSVTNPFLTIQHAINVSTDGYTVLVHPGTYVENINFNGKNITVTSTDGPDSTIIDGNNNGSVVTFENGEDSALLEGFTVTNGNGTYSDPVGTGATSGFAHRGGGIFINLSKPNIVNVKILNNSAKLGGGIYALRSTPAITNTVISGNSSNQHGGGLYYQSHSVRYPTLTNVLISGNTAPKGAGASFNYSTRATLTHVTISANTATTSGGAIWRGNASNVTVKNSVIWGNTPAPIYWEGGTSSTSQIDYSLVEGAGSGTLITWGTGNFDVDPLFVDAGGGDYRLGNSSPAIDVGTSTGVPNYDINGVTRPQGSGWDMGAYEYQDSPSKSLLAIYALAFDTLATHDLSWAYSDVMQGLRAATANDANKRAVVVVDMPGADNTFVYELQGGNETLISGLPDTSGGLSSAIHEYDMTDGATLGGFLLWARNTYSADKTTFSYVGHGGPLIPETDFEAIFSDSGNLTPDKGHQRRPSRVDVSPGFTDITPQRKVLSIYQLSEALRIGTNDGVSRLDVVDLVHCFASSIEEYVALHAYADTMTGSPSYTFFAPEMLGKGLDGIDPSADANTMADTIIQQYDSAIENHDDPSTPADDHPRLLVAVDSDKIPAIKQKWDEVSYRLWQNFDRAKIENAYTNSAHYDTTYCEPQDWQLASPDAVVDLKTFASELKAEFGSPVSVPVNTLLLRIDDAVINSYKQNGQPWFADDPLPTWDFDNHSGIGIYADFVGTPRGGDIHLSWHAEFYTDTVTTDNPHPYAFLQGGFAGINWGDVFNRFWQDTPNLDRDACLSELPPLLSSGELAVSQIIFPRLATVTDDSPVQIMAAISTAHAAINTTVAFTVTQSSTTVFAHVVHIPGLLVTGTHLVEASQAWVPALANPNQAEPFTLEVMVDHDNHVSETNELDNLLTMSDVVAPAPALPRPIITATIPNNLQWITDTTVSLNVVQAPSTQPPPVQTVEVQVYQYVAGSTPNTQVPVLLNSQTFSSVSLPQALNVSLSALTPGPVVFHVWGWSTSDITIYPSVVNFNYIPPNTALPAGEQHDFLFNANAGDALEFDLNALTGDPNMFLWTPNNSGVPTWSATAVGTDYLNPNAPVQGEYLLSVYGQISGTYTLTTTRNSVPYARQAQTQANNPNAYVPDGRPTFTEPIPEAPSAVASTSISLQAGWNHASLSLQPLVGYSAETLCDEINQQGGNAVEIDRWHNAGWEGHVCGLPFNDFDLLLGESYFIRSNSASNWTIAGYRVAEALPLTVQTGWNSISIPHTDSYTAESLCDDLISQGVDVVEIDRWHNSGWQGHICGVPFNNFNLERHTGYFIKSNSSGTINPTAQALIRQPLNDLPAPPEAVSTAQAVPIHDLQRSNLRDTSVTLSWTTQQATTGYVRFGETPETMSQVAYDSRGATSSRTTHQVVLNHLTPETSYYFEIVSGAEAQERNREPYSVTTLSPLDNVPPSDTIYGQIYQADGVTPATGTLVYLQLQDADDAGSPKEAGLISALVDEQGYWHANLGNARLTEGSGSFAYAIKSDRLLLTTQRAAADTVTHTLDTNHLRPAQPLTLPPQAGWQLYLPLIQN